MASSVTPGEKSIGSDWGALSDKLIAKFYPVEPIPASAGGQPFQWARDMRPNAKEQLVASPLTDSTIEQAATWTSPFESMQADNKVSTFSSMLQSGGFDSLLQALLNDTKEGSWANKTLKGLQSSSNEMAGKSAITRLNSRQIFTGLPPMKITVTAHFRATSDAYKEVEKPLIQLMQWALPKKLSDQTLTQSMVEGKWRHPVDALYASEAPQIIGMEYAGRIFMPLVIESISQPLTGSRDSNGYLLSAQVTLSLSTLTGLDESDYGKTNNLIIKKSP